MLLLSEVKGKKRFLSYKSTGMPVKGVESTLAYLTEEEFIIIVVQRIFGRAKNRFLINKARITLKINPCAKLIFVYLMLSVSW